MYSGRIFITQTGYDPQHGKELMDPIFGNQPSLGICRPDFRKACKPGDWFFVVSGSVPGHDQLIVGGFEVQEKIHATEAYRRFPEQRLHKVDRVLHGNIIVNEQGQHNPLDDHKNFDRRVTDYVVGRNALSVSTPEEIALAREETMPCLQRVFGRIGSRPIDVLGRARKMDSAQVDELAGWLRSIGARSARSTG
jgi:hypothetical protein